MAQYYSEYDYLSSATTIKEKISKINEIIAVLEESALKSATRQHIDEYWLDDGQTRIKTVYRSMDEVVNGLFALNKLKEIYTNKLKGRIVRLVDEKNFRVGR